MISLAGVIAWQWRDLGTEKNAAQANLDAYKRSVQDLLDHGVIKQPKMVRIDAGTFTMGSQKGDNDEQPVRKVTISSFLMSQYEVTFEEYDQFAVATGRDDLPGDSGWGREKRPVINVSWQDAVAYAAWLTKRTKALKPYRLPSEAEWEFAAGGNGTSDYWWGPKIRQGGKVWAVCDGCGSMWDNKQSAPVGQFPANPNRLYDTAGNVWEWVEDCYHDSYERAPGNGLAWVDKRCESGLRVIRGGSWNSTPGYLRSAHRGGNAPGTRNGYLGFRLAQDLK
jgi:formylglycine-generating enzyme required for sulfatase activity